MNIDPKILKALALFASKDATRYMLMCVRLEVGPEHTIAVACDGRRLAAYRFPTVDHDGSVRNVNIPLDLIKKMPTWKKMPSFLEFTDDTVTAKTDWSVTMKQVEGEYPKWRMVVPTIDKHGTLPTMVHGLLLTDFGKAFKILGVEEHIRIFQNDYTSSMIVTNESIPDFVGVLMPCRMTDEQKLWVKPEWVK